MKNKINFTVALALLSIMMLFGCKTTKTVVHKKIIEKPTQKVPWRPWYYSYFKRNDTAIVKALSFYPSVKLTIAGAFIDGEMHVEDGKLRNNDSVTNVYRRIDTSRSGRLAIPFRSLSGPLAPMVITFSVSDKTYILTFHAERHSVVQRSGRAIVDTIFFLNPTARLFFNGKYQNASVRTQNNERCKLLFYNLHDIFSDTSEEEAEGLEGGNTAPKKKQ
jgi:hypothetical protein